MYTALIGEALERRERPFALKLLQVDVHLDGRHGPQLLSLMVAALNGARLRHGRTSRHHPRRDFTRVTSASSPAAAVSAPVGEVVVEVVRHDGTPGWRRCVEVRDVGRVEPNVERR